MNINFKNVYFSYGKKSNNVLKNINLTFDKNEIICIMGHTGSGKSTLVQHINGLLLPTSGEVRVSIDKSEFILNNKYKEKNLKELRRNIGLVFQFPENQLFETTVIKDVMFAPMNFYNDEKKAKELASASLEKVGINKSFYERSPLELSGGEKRKVAIAGVLSSNPEVIIMDEPTSSLDFFSSREIMELLKKLKEEGKLIIIISHDTDLCYEYGDRIIILNEGEIIEDRRVEDSFCDKVILDKASLIEPFVNKVKRVLKIKDKSIRSIKALKEVIKRG